MPGDFGSYLKSERELRGISLEEISDITKVRLSFLRAIESNDFDEFPGEVFIKGYIRSYAKAIGSDVDQVLNTYDDEIGRDRKAKILERERKILDASGGDGSLLKFVLSLALLLAIGAGIYFVFYNLPGGGNKMVKSAGNSEKPSESVEPLPVPRLSPSADTSVQVKTKSLVEAMPSGKSVGSEAPVIVEAVKQTQAISEAQKTQSTVKEEQIKKEATAPEEPVPPTAVSALHTLQIQAKEKSWFSLAIDKLSEEEFILQAGTQKQFSANDRFKITIGNRAGVVLILNGKPLVLPEGKQNVIRDFIINPKKEE